MSETRTERRRDVIVVGGGLAGLVAACTAARAGADVLLVEGRDLGGRARTDRRQGFTFNRGPRALYVDGQAAPVLADLGVRTDRGGAPDTSAARGLRGGQLHVVPQGPMSLLRTTLVSARQKPTVAAVTARIPRLDPERFAGLTADQAIDRLRLPAAGADLLRALVRLTTYAAATDELDGVAAIRQLQLGLTTGVRYLDGGWQTLVDDLARRATELGVEVRRDTAVQALAPSADGNVEVRTSSGDLLAGTAVVATGTPAAATALLGRPVAESGRLGPPALAACLELGLRRPPAVPFVIGIDEPVYLSTHCPPADLAPEGGAVVHVMRYLRSDDADRSDEVRSALRALAARAGIAPGDVVEERFLARMTVTGALPTAATGGLAGRPPVEDPTRPGVLLAGDWVGPDGLLADAAASSAATAGRLAAARGARLAVA
ncbi:FAD-dependent oxidoreductase [Actinomarinicola tropica]|uniref:FAD-dependent oxidoreductase n=1 Tax=Actinomarinicola tropica TaxID=2789776 RepID=UPI001898CE71|nr:FAD-dependent oxidoreductase [Actinomarinicola tropica]